MDSRTEIKAENGAGRGGHGGTSVLRPRAPGGLGKVYAGGSQDLVSIIKSSCWLQCAEQTEESKFPFNGKREEAAE